jgi:hypothetical protein
MKYFIIYNLPKYTPFYLMCFIKYTKSDFPPQNKST